ncbi:MAG: polyprenyl synthetase family protein [Planctomycetes bacterium]|nr:polyprenyl synthetase family protein [Planctomycetota bacterium]
MSGATTSGAVRSSGGDPGSGSGDAVPAATGRGSFEAFCAEWRPRVEAELGAWLPPADELPARLHEAMRYTMFPGGKRLRPMLALLAARATDGDVEQALPAAAALELLHTYSLVHDDLPCMDDDALRRGRPTCHVVYGDALAVLAGDALLTLAFEAVATAGGDAAAALARAAGSRGMVGGQVLDLEAEDLGAAVTLPRLEGIHDRKTGALIVASLEVGMLAGGGDRGRWPALRDYGLAIGRAFQIADDCLDVTGTAQELGKAPGQDAAHGKSTYPALLGLPRSLEIAHELAARAAALAPQIRALPAGAAVDAAGAILQDLATSVVDRRS